MTRRGFLKALLATPVVVVAATKVERFLELVGPAPRTLSYQDMLNEYLPIDLLREELQRRGYLLSRIPKSDAWSGATLEVPFVAKT